MLHKTYLKTISELNANRFYRDTGAGYVSWGTFKFCVTSNFVCPITAYRAIDTVVTKTGEIKSST
jgi:hypothetical protein